MISENQSMPTILVADSDDDNRYLLRSLLELKGFHVFLATDGQEAIDTAVRKHPDLVLRRAITACFSVDSVGRI